MGGERQVKKTVKPRVARGDDVSGACAPAPPTGRALTPLNLALLAEKGKPYNRSFAAWELHLIRRHSAAPSPPAQG